MKSDLKKATAFVRKIRQITNEGLSQCIREIETLNLYLYVSEIVGAIVDTTFKSTDVPNIVSLCVCFHKRYEEFTKPLRQGLRQSLLAPSPNEDDKEFGLKRRIQIRFAIELYQVGILLDDNFFCDLLKHLLGRSKTGKSSSLDLLGVCTFVKYGSECLLGKLPRPLILLAQKANMKITEMPVKLIANPVASTEMRNNIDEVFKELCDDLVKAFKDYKSQERRCEEDKLLHGSLTEHKEKNLDAAKKLFEKLLSATTSLAEPLGEEVPLLEEDKEEEEKVTASGGGLSVFSGGAIGPSNYGPHDSMESKSFYEDLPDLLAIVPLVAFGLTIEQANKLREEWKASKEEVLASTEDEEKDDTPVELNDIDEKTSGDNEKTDSATDTSNPDDGNDETPQAKVLLLLQDKLPNCTNKQRADDFCVSFCYLNSKGARKKLVEALVSVPRFRTDLVSTYSRIIATLCRVLPKAEIAEPVSAYLWRHFYGQLKSKTQDYLETKIKTVRYICEMVKFGLNPPMTIFKMLKLLFKDFTNHNIELIAAIFETCGRYLYLTPYTHDRLEESLNTMLRLRRQQHVNARHQSLLEVAYFSVKPPERASKEKKVLTNLQKYARYLILEKLNTSNVNVDNVIKSLRRLPWNNQEENLQLYVVKYVMKSVRTKISSAANIADCLSGLMKHCPNLVITIIDKALAEIERGLETPVKLETQRLLGVVRLMGELYNYSVIPDIVVFDLLYHIINHGHSNTDITTLKIAAPSQNQPIARYEQSILYDPRIPTDYDPPSEPLRVLMVCEILNTCGYYYVHGKHKRSKLSRFLLFFQRYLFTKSSLPFHVDFTLIDTLEELEEKGRSAIIAEETKKQAKFNKSKNTKSFKAPTIEIKGPVFPSYDTIEAVQEIIDSLAPKNIDDEESDEESDDDDDDNVNEDNINEDENADDINPENDDDVDDSEVVRLMEKMRIAEEDDEFEKAFRAVMLESVESVRSSGVVKSSDLSKMALPAVIPKAKNIDEESSSSGLPSGGIAFKLLSRDAKGRMEARQLMVPEDNDIAIKVAKTVAVMNEEKQQLKKRVLQINALTEEQGQLVGDEEINVTADYFDGVAYDGEKKTHTNTFTGNSRGRGRGRGGAHPYLRNTSKVSETQSLDQFLKDSHEAEQKRWAENNRRKMVDNPNSNPK